MIRFTLSFFFVVTLWLRLALWLDSVSRNIGFALLCGGTLALLALLAVWALIDRRARSYQR